MPNLLRVAFVGVLLLATLSLAQSFLGSIVGNIVDPSGATVPLAKVIVTEAATGLERQLITDNQGRYTVSNLPPGTYEVAVSMEGSRSFTAARLFSPPSRPRGSMPRWKSAREPRALRC
jgi:hypothetical protein